jgi:hypothetical protein
MSSEIYAKRKDFRCTRIKGKRLQCAKHAALSKGNSALPSLPMRCLTDAAQKHWLFAVVGASMQATLTTFFVSAKKCIIISSMAAICVGFSMRPHSQWLIEATGGKAFAYRRLALARATASAYTRQQYSWNRDPSPNRRRAESANRRKGFLRKKGRRTAGAYGAACIKDLSIKGMSQSPNLSKSV